MAVGHRRTLGSYLCIGLLQKAELMSKQRQGKVLNICVEYLNNKGRSAQTSAHLYIWVQVYTKRTDH